MYGNNLLTDRMSQLLIFMGLIYPQTSIVLSYTIKIVVKVEKSSVQIHAEKFLEELFENRRKKNNNFPKLINFMAMKSSSI